jgi:hypothetical protein
VIHDSSFSWLFFCDLINIFLLLWDLIYLITLSLWFHLSLKVEICYWWNNYILGFLHIAKKNLSYNFNVCLLFAKNDMLFTMYWFSIYLKPISELSHLWYKSNSTRTSLYLIGEMILIICTSQTHPWQTCTSLVKWY